MPSQTSAIAELTGGIILTKFERSDSKTDSYQTEAQLEEKFIADLVHQGYEKITISSQEELFGNLKSKIEQLNHVTFTPAEWQRFLAEYLNPPSDSPSDKAKKINIDYVYDFIFDSGKIENIKIIDKKNINNNILQVANQIEQTGSHHNRYDVTILVNGLPLVQVELKKREQPISQAFNQISRYKQESFNHGDSLFKFLQIFVISNGTYTRYFANTTARNKDNYEFTCQWADAKNSTIDDLEDFTATFFEKRCLLEILTKYCVFTADNTLLVMRPYQIAAAERIINKLKSSYENKLFSKPLAGGFIWHTTGSGKTLTSFKAAQLAVDLDFIDKVFFVVDRKDLDYQTMKEYQKFQADSVNGSKDVKALKANIEKTDGKIIVTTIQKLHEFLKRNPSHAIYERRVVLIFDECHRSQFGDAQKKIQSHFKHYYQFGFTGTPIFAENAVSSMTTADVFGAQLHSYVITDAIRDKKVLKFKVDYNAILPQFKQVETEQDENKLKAAEKTFLHPERIKAVVAHILKVYDQKTHRSEIYKVKGTAKKGFNAMFAVQDIAAAKAYYQEFKKQQKDLPTEKQLSVATIYSFAANEDTPYIGEIKDESFELKAMQVNDKNFLEQVMADYNKTFATNYTTDGNEFQNYYKDLSMRVKEKEIDLIIVVGMFLTGFDAPALNTLFVDKNLRYHGLIQAFSRTNRILNITKSVGNIVCFRDLEKATKDSIKLFGDENSVNIILEKSYNEYMDGSVDDSGVKFAGYKELCKKLLEKFPIPQNIHLKEEKKEFVETFGEVLKIQNVLRNFDEFHSYEGSISERAMQDYRSTYVDIREEAMREKFSQQSENTIDLSTIEFHVELISTDEIDLDYILRLIAEKIKENKSTNDIKTDISRVMRSNIETRGSEQLMVEFLDTIPIDKNSTDTINQVFYEYAKAEKIKEINNLTKTENLNEDANEYIEQAIANGFVSNQGTELDSILPPISRRQGEREKKKQTVLEKIQKLVDKFKNI